MAWKEYSELSIEDKRHEDVRQKMIVCQSCSDRAVHLVIKASERDGAKNDIATLSLATRTIAGVLVDWVYEKANEKTPEPASNVSLPNASLPTPTAIQAKVLDKIAAELRQDMEIVKSRVLDWAEETHKIRKYPENVNSINDFIKWNSKGE